MKIGLRRVKAAVGALAIALAAVAAGATSAAADSPATITGTSVDGSKYLIEKPADWNGTLVLYSHGYEVSVPTTPPDAGDAATRAWLLAHGYAIGGSTYATGGWALQQAFPDQMDVLNAFAAHGYHPTRTIAWGHSLGGMITAGLVQLHPEAFQGAIPMCGVVGGGIGAWNQGLDAEFAFKTLLAPTSTLQLVNITNPFANLGQALGILQAAQATPQGKARIALAAALADTPGWFDPASPEPLPTQYADREANQFLWDQNVDFFFSFAARAELEARAGGNFSWNDGVNYNVQLAHSVDADEVAALYSAAGLDLAQDLATLNAAPRISVTNPNAEAYVEQYITYNGQLSMPVLTMHTTGDGLVQVEHEQSYASAVRQAGNNSLLRQVFVHRAGHCTFTPAETVAALQTLVHRLDTGRWEASTTAAAMNATASGLGIGPADFITFQPPQFLRPFTAVQH